MRSLRARLTLWFGLSLLAMLAIFAAFTYRYLESELHQKNWRTDYPNHPDWKLHGSFSEAEVRDLLGELVETNLAWALPFAGIALLAGYGLARKSLRPIASLNQQLQVIDRHQLSRRIDLAEMDDEFRDLVRHLNELLGRLESSFRDISEYTAKVAHELRTPLSIMRLKVEQAGDRVPAEFVEELQAQLHHLTHVVDQSLLIAKAEQGRLAVQFCAFDLAAMVADLAEDFSLLAQEQARALLVRNQPSCNVNADPKYARQILHNLLSNALKHGEGNITLKLAPHQKEIAVIIFNRVRREATPAEETLGLGLRVVETLLHMQPGMTCARRRGKPYYAVRLALPAAETARLPSVPA